MKKTKVQGESEYPYEDNIIGSYIVIHDDTKNTAWKER